MRTTSLFCHIYMLCNFKCVFFYIVPVHSEVEEKPFHAYVLGKSPLTFGT